MLIHRCPLSKGCVSAEISVYSFCMNVVSNFFLSKRSQSFIIYALFVWLFISVPLILLVAWYAFDTRLESAQSTTASIAFAPRSSSTYQVEVLNPESEVGAIVGRVSKHIYLPKGEVAVMTILDADALRQDDPAVYEYARNGHKLLFYPNGVILYDPIADLIVDVIRANTLKRSIP